MNIEVVLPIHRGRQWVVEAVESVLEQSYEGWTLTLVDDASPDASIEILEKYLISYPQRISLLRFEEQRGVAAARMAAIERSCCDAIAFIDQDDRWHRDKLALQVQRLKGNGELAAVHTDVIHIDAMGQLMEGSSARENRDRNKVGFDQLSNSELVSELFLRNSIRLASALVLRDPLVRVGGFRSSLRGGEDWDFWVRLAARYSVGHLALPLLERRIHESNTSSVNAAARSEGSRNALALVVSEFPALKPLESRRSYQIEQTSAVEALRCGRFSEARRSARRAVGVRPMEWRGTVLWILALMGSRGALVVKWIFGDKRNVPGP